jgi:hypothetical protein
MGRNTRVRNHRYIPNGKKKPKRIFNWSGLQAYANRLSENSEKASVALNCILLLLPWAVLFALGGLVNPVAAGTDVSTQFDTVVFLMGGLAVLIIAVVFAIMLRGRGKR